MTELLRLAVAVAILLLLARAVRPAWRNRALALRVWSRIRPRHVLGSIALLAVVIGVAGTLLTYVPATRVGLGSLVGLSGNAVFAPVEQVAARDGGGVGGGVTLALTGGFLVLLLTLFPWFAYAEERAFREGLERAGPGREVWTALRFGLAHLIMLVPVAAALAIGVAGFAYGRIYRRAYARAAARSPTGAAGADGTPESSLAGAGGPAPPAHLRAARAEAVLASTVWHTTFNSLVVVLVFTSLALGSV